MQRAPADVLEIFLQPGEVYFGEAKTRIRTLLGSCVAITLWHPGLRVGGMCHYMLPRHPQRKSDRVHALDGRYGEDVMRMILAEITRLRTRPSEYHVKLFGGSRMFLPTAPATAHRGISEANVEFGRAAIAQCGFKILAEDVGGELHRNIFLDLWSGDVWVRKPMPPVRASTTRRGAKAHV